MRLVSHLCRLYRLWKPIYQCKLIQTSLRSSSKGTGEFLRQLSLTVEKPWFCLAGCYKSL